jgi:dTDP-4-dehydrorhamnose 3,5-epimerase-like enzyme
VLWNDPAFGIRWPIESPQVSASDRAYAPFDAASWKRSY